MSAAAAPTVSVDPASSVGFTSVKATGEVNPGEKETFCHFEYISDKQLEENEANGDPGFANAAAAGCDVEPLSGNTAQAVAANLENLTSATIYHLRLVASNEDGTEVAPAPNFTTQTATPPALALNPPSGVSYTKAHISGTVDPEGGNVNPIGGPVPIAWQLEINFQGFWEWVEGGVIQEAEAEASAPIAVSKDLEFLPPNTNFKFRLKAFYTGRETTQAGGEFTTLAVSQPTVVADDATSVTGTAAHFSGTVTAGGEDPAFNTNCTFDYVTAAQFGIDEFAGASQVGCDINPVTGTAPTAVVADPTDLQPNTTYHLRLRGENAGGQSTSMAPDTFTTDALAPTIADAFATDVTQGSATLNAMIRPGGIPTTYHFDYLTLAQFEANGETFAGASQTPESASIGSDNSVHQVSASVSGLQLGTAYRFRVVATNAQSAPGGTPGVAVGFTTNSATAGQSCPNEQLRIENNSVALPDCRAYELVTPDSNHASLGSQPSGRAGASGDVMAYQVIDSPNNAKSGSVFNIVRAKRDPAAGWSGVSLSPYLPKPVSSYASFNLWGFAQDLTSTFFYGDQPFAGPNPPSGQNSFVGRPDGTNRLLTEVGTPFIPGLEVYSASPGFSWGTPDFGTVYFQPPVAQNGEDPTFGGNSYAWSEDRGLRLVGILPGTVADPDGEPAPNGASIAGDAVRVPGMRPTRPGSVDGKYVAFIADDILYLRIDDKETVELGPASTAPAGSGIPDLANVAADGSSVVFTSTAELTPDANTGGGTGRDLYRYDIATGELTDLTVDGNDTAGADVQSIAGITSDNSRIYFAANGNLAPGATPGQRSLYVWHDGAIDFVASAKNLALDGDTLQPFFYLTPDGEHAVFASFESLTGYDNTDPLTGQAHSEVFEANSEGNLTCLSCRADGTRPTGDSGLPFYHGLPPGKIRVASDDGSRVFFQSFDAIVPEASSGRQVVYQYANGKASPISPPRGTSQVTFLDTTPSGNDVFFSTYDELVSNPYGHDAAVYDARVGGGFPSARSESCSGPSCQGAPAVTPAAGVPGSRTLTGPGNKHTHPCKKGTVRKHGKCVKKKGTKKKHGTAKKKNQKPAARGAK
jgi:hypothetical protein